MRTPFSTKLVVVLVGIIALVMSAFVAARFYQTIEQTRGNLAERSAQVALRISNAVNPAIWNIYRKSTDRAFSADVASAILDSELVDPYVVGILVYGNFGHLYMGKVKLDDGRVVQYDPSQRALLAAADEHQRYPIKNGVMSIGRVDVYFTHRPAEQLLRESLRFEALQIGVVSLLVVVLLYVGIRSALLVPLRSLTIAKQTLEALDEAVVLFDRDRRVIDINPAFTTVTGFQREQVLGQLLAFSAEDLHPAGFESAIWSAVEEVGHWRGEVRNRRAEGGEFDAWLHVNAVRDEQGHVMCLQGGFSDISARKRAEQDLRQLAYFDSLTGLLNRSQFADVLQGEIAQSHRRNESLGLLFIDLDNFKHVNDTLGHAHGDLLLVEISTRFNDRLRETDTLARLGGDEFTVIAPGQRDEKELGTLAADLIELARQPVVLDGREVYIGASVGIAVFPRDGGDVEELIKRADTAMYQAKDSGRNRYRYYSPELDARSQHRLELRQALHQAVRGDEFRLLYQPKVALDSGRIVGAEALIRWQRADGELVSPQDFIPLAEESALIIEIGNWVIGAVCRQIEDWHARGLGGFAVALNLSARQLHDGEVVEVLRREMAAHGVEPARLEVEITESAVIQDIDDSIDTLRRLDTLGVAIAMDDFGTGYSSLSYLKRLPVNILKIDRSFVRDVPGDKDDAAIVSAIISLARALELDIVAEGIETSTQLDFLTARGCRTGQGYHFSPPVEPAAFEALLRGGEQPVLQAGVG